MAKCNQLTPLPFKRLTKHNVKSQWIKAVEHKRTECLSTNSAVSIILLMLNKCNKCNKKHQYIYTAFGTGGIISYTTTQAMTKYPYNCKSITMSMSLNTTLIICSS